MDFADAVTTLHATGQLAKLTAQTEDTSVPPGRKSIMRSLLEPGVHQIERHMAGGDHQRPGDGSMLSELQRPQTLKKMIAGSQLNVLS